MVPVGKINLKDILFIGFCIKSLLNILKNSQNKTWDRIHTGEIAKKKNTFSANICDCTHTAHMNETICHE